MPSSNHTTVLMTGAGAPGAAGILNCLSRETSFRVIAADANPMVVGHFIATDFVTIPPANAPDFIESLLAICSKKQVEVILPLVTRELMPLSNRLPEFESIGTRIPVSPTSSLEIANNKSRLYEFLQWRGIPVPDFRVIENIEQFRNAVTELGYPQKAVCFKPSASNGSRGFRVMSTQANELDLLLNQKPNSTYLSFQDAVRILSSGSFPELLVSEFLPGDEYSVDCLAKHGDAVLVVPRLRKRMINGISVEGEFIKNEKIIAYCSLIIRELKLHGNIGIQVKADNNGEFLILEINPRVQGTISAGLGAGVNLPVLAIKQELGLPVNPEELSVKWGTHFIRHWNEVFF